MLEISRSVQPHFVILLNIINIIQRQYSHSFYKGFFNFKSSSLAQDRAMGWLRVLLPSLSLDKMLVHHRLTPHPHPTYSFLSDFLDSSPVSISTSGCREGLKE